MEEGKERVKEKTKKKIRKNCEKTEITADQCLLGRDVVGPVGSLLTLIIYQTTQHHILDDTVTAARTSYFAKNVLSMQCLCQSMERVTKGIN
jgi:hypothetical protein